MAHVEKRGPRRWRARYRGPDGRERSKTFERRVDAERWLVGQEAGKLTGAWVDPALGRMTFAEWADRWETTTVDLRPTTRALNLGVLRNYLLPRFGSWPLARITTADVKAMIAEESAGSLSASAVRRHAIILGTILGAAVQDGRIARNPVRGVKLPPEDARPMRFLEPSVLTRLADAHPPSYRPLVLTAAYVGLRWGELVGLAVDHVDLLHRTIRVDRQLVEVAGSISFGPPKTKAGNRTVTLPASLGEILAEHFSSPTVRASGWRSRGRRAPRSAAPTSGAFGAKPVRPLASKGLCSMS
jgi:integrase